MRLHYGKWRILHARAESHQPPHGWTMLRSRFFESQKHQHAQTTFGGRCGRLPESEQAMTRSHALKSEIRKAMQPGEAFNAAALRLRNAAAAPTALPRIITAYAYQGSHPQKRHALVDHPATRARMGVGNLVIQGRALCGNRGGSPENGGWRLETAPGDNMSRHSGVDYAPEESGYCQECTIAWRAQFQPDDETTKACLSCNRDLPTNKFRSHKGRKDGLAAECEQCRQAAKLAAEKEKGIAQQEGAMEKRRQIAAEWLQIVNDWQESPYLKPFECSDGHALKAEITERRHDVALSWRCTCGTAVITRAEFQLLSAMRAVQHAADSNPMTVAVA